MMTPWAFGVTNKGLKRQRAKKSGYKYTYTLLCSLNVQTYVTFMISLFTYMYMLHALSPPMAARIFLDAELKINLNTTAYQVAMSTHNTQILN